MPQEDSNPKALALRRELLSFSKVSPEAFEPASPEVR